MSGVVLEATDLARFYQLKRGFMRKPATVRALAGASFTLKAGKTLAVVGESGCGKSTLARAVTLIEEPTSGKLIIDGKDTSSAANRKELREKVQIVFQDPYGSLNPRKKVRDIIGEPLAINRDHSASEREGLVKEMMVKVGLRPEHVTRYPHMFSGGQRQRIAIARALMLRPQVLVADEPVSALDLSVQAQVLNLLMDLQAEFDLAYLFISHDLSVVQHIADELMVMYLGRPVEQGAKGRIFQTPRHPYTRALLSATPVADPAKRRQRIPLTGELPSPLNPPSGCAFHRRCPFAIEQCRQDRPELRSVDSRLVACHRAEEDLPAPSAAAAA
ncbi:MAG: ABC transporter ATP-binding protein [Alphaproteobacteria bacterium]|nr:ABC transporter ATP-binding protein [Alphaproteobacteria bacterium]